VKPFHIFLQRNVKEMLLITF